MQSEWFSSLELGRLGSRLRPYTYRLPYTCWNVLNLNSNTQCYTQWTNSKLSANPRSCCNGYSAYLSMINLEKGDMSMPDANVPT